MELLPSEIINEILLLVDKPSLYHAAQVCVQWRQLALKQVVVINSIVRFVEACHEGDRLSVIKSDKNKPWLSLGLKIGCNGGHMNIVELMIRMEVFTMRVEVVTKT